MRLETVSSHNIVWHVDPSRAVEFRQWLDRHFDSVFSDGPGLLKADSGSQVAAASGLVMKRMRARNGLSKSFFAVRPSRSRRFFKLSERLCGAGLPVPRAVAWATERCAGFRVADYFVMDEVQNCVRLDKWSSAPEFKKSKATVTLRQYGALIGSFHSVAYSNRDLKDTNILVTGSDEPKLWAIDLGGVRACPFLCGYRARRDFVPLIRFLNDYDLNTPENRAVVMEGYSEAMAGFEKIRVLAASL